MKVPGLTELANRLRDIYFPDEDNVLDREIIRRMEAHETHACYLVGRGPSFVAKFSLGGEVRCLGFSHSGADAARFADMCRVHFHKYKLHGGWKPLEDRDLNFDMEQVNEDFANVEKAVALISDIEHLLLDQGVIKHPKAVEADREALVTARRTRRTVGQEILDRVKLIESRLTTLEVGVEALRVWAMGNGKPND